jgi:hypothetical protein
LIICSAAIASDGGTVVPVTYLNDVQVAQAAWEDACTALEEYHRLRPVPSPREAADEQTELEVLQSEEREAWIVLRQLRGF